MASSIIYSKLGNLDIKDDSIICKYIIVAKVVLTRNWQAFWFRVDMPQQFCASTDFIPPVVFLAL